MMMMRISAVTPPRFGTFISGGDYPAGGGIAAPVKAPDAGMRPAGNGLLVRQSGSQAVGPTLIDPMSIDDPAIATRQLVENLHMLLGHFSPTELNDLFVNFHPAVLIDDQVVHIDVEIKTRDFVGDDYVTLPTPRIRNITISSHAGTAFYSWPPTAQQIAERGPGSVTFAFTLRVCAALQQRLTAPDAAVERRLRTTHAEERNRFDEVEVPLATLYGDRFRETAARLHAIEEHIAERAPVGTVPYVDFVRVVARVVKHHRPDKRSITGDEQSWKELEQHEGLYATNFARVYAPSWDQSSKSFVINLLAIAHDLAQGHTVDHGYDPLRNRFWIIPVQDGDWARISICSGIDEEISGRNISAFLALYQILADSGLPVAIDENVRSLALGTGTKRVRRDDSRLPLDSGYFLTANNVVISAPLPPDTAKSLPTL